MRLFLTKKNYWSISDKLKKYFKFDQKKVKIFSFKSDTMHSSVGFAPVLCETRSIKYIELIWARYNIGPDTIYCMIIPIGSKLEFKGTTIKITIYDNIVHHFAIQTLQPIPTNKNQ